MNQSRAFRANVVERRTRMWRGKRRADAKRAMAAAEQTCSDEELIRQAERDGKVTRLPPASAVGGSMAECWKDWK